jgi:hypothetical protein
MAARDVRAAGGCYGDPHLVLVDELISDTQSKSTRVKKTNSKKNEIPRRYQNSCKFTLAP